MKMIDLSVNRKNIFRIFCSLFIISAFAMFLFLLRYDTPLYGDDVSALVKNDPDNTYVDDRVAEGACTLKSDFSVKTFWDNLCRSYLTWTGRMMALFLSPMVRIIFFLPDGINWVIFTLYIMGMLLTLLILTACAICGNWKDSVKAPVVALLTGILLFYIPSYSYAYMTRLIMFMFADIYVVSVIFYLAFYMVIRRVYERHAELLQISGSTVPGKSACATRTLIGANLLGLFAGLSHEAYGVIFGMVLLTQLIRFWLKNHRRISIRYLFMYIGYIIGFCICFFAPGNFNRAAQSHESALHTVSLPVRIFNSIYIHAFVAYKIWIIPVIVLPGLVILFTILLKKRVLTVKDLMYVFLNNLEWFLGFGMSAIIWGMVARVVSYGLLLANVLLIIGVIRVIRELWELIVSRTAVSEIILTKIQIISAGISVAAVVLLAVKCFPQISDVHQVADVWREDIKVARKEGMEEIVVPTYPEDLDYRFYDLTIINRQENYDKIATQVVYGTHVVLDNQHLSE